MRAYAALAPLVNLYDSLPGAGTWLRKERKRVARRTWR